jgi:hypothetical protein
MHDGVHLCLVPKVVPFLFPRGGKDMLLLDIHRKVIVALVLPLIIWLVLIVLQTSSWLRLRSSLQGAAERDAPAHS